MSNLKYDTQMMSFFKQIILPAPSTVVWLASQKMLSWREKKKMKPNPLTSKILQFSWPKTQGCQKKIYILSNRHGQNYRKYIYFRFSPFKNMFFRFFFFSNFLKNTMLQIIENFNFCPLKFLKNHHVNKKNICIFFHKKKKKKKIPQRFKKKTNKPTLLTEFENQYFSISF